MCCDATSNSEHMGSFFTCTNVSTLCLVFRPCIKSEKKIAWGYANNPNDRYGLVGACQLANMSSPASMHCTDGFLLMIRGSPPIALGIHFQATHSSSSPQQSDGCDHDNRSCDYRPRRNGCTKRAGFFRKKCRSRIERCASPGSRHAQLRLHDREESFAW